MRARLLLGLLLLRSRRAAALDAGRLVLRHEARVPDGLAQAGYRALLAVPLPPSGSSVRGRSRTRPLGPATLRKALYLPAVVAMRANPALPAFAERLRAAGTCPKVVVVAVMRKLLGLAWTLLRSGHWFSFSQGTRASTP